jgi:hypothetical protein
MRIGGRFRCILLVNSVLEPRQLVMYKAVMSSSTQEIVQVFEMLPLEKQQEVTDFARFLLSRRESGDEAWERIIADPKPRPKLEAFCKASAQEGSEPLDISKM